jgi:uncharacterized membrane protein YqjE
VRGPARWFSLQLLTFSFLLLPSLSLLVFVCQCESAVLLVLNISVDDSARNMVIIVLSLCFFACLIPVVRHWQSRLKERRQRQQMERRRQQMERQRQQLERQRQQQMEQLRLGISVDHVTWSNLWELIAYNQQLQAQQAALQHQWQESETRLADLRGQLVHVETASRDRLSLTAQLVADSCDDASSHFPMAGNISEMLTTLRLSARRPLVDCVRVEKRDSESLQVTEGRVATLVMLSAECVRSRIVAARQHWSKMVQLGPFGNAYLHPERLVVVQRVNGDINSVAASLRACVRTSSRSALDHCPTSDVQLQGLRVAAVAHWRRHLAVHPPPIDPTLSSLASALWDQCMRPTRLTLQDYPVQNFMRACLYLVQSLALTPREDWYLSGVIAQVMPAALTDDQILLSVLVHPQSAITAPLAKLVETFDVAGSADTREAVEQRSSQLPDEQARYVLAFPALILRQHEQQFTINIPGRAFFSIQMDNGNV